MERTQKEKMKPNCTGMDTKLAGLLLDPDAAPAKVRTHVDGCDRCLDRRTLPLGAEVRAQPRPEVARSPDIQQLPVPVVEEIDARSCGRARSAGGGRGVV